MSILPTRFEAMLEQSLKVVTNDEWQKKLRPVAYTIAEEVWKHWLAWRPAEDNRPEHEWVVFDNVMRIAEKEGLNLSERRIATAFAFTHDTFFIPRITSSMVDAEKDPTRKAELLKEKETQRDRHMEGGAKYAAFILQGLKHPTTGDTLLLKDEIEKCVAIIENHDRWKMTPPEPPPSADRLAVVCLEADALWPLHPLGVLADLERPEAKDNLFNPLDWRKELESSLETLRGKHRSQWANTASSDFKDTESIFRTQGGYDIYTEWLKFWKLS